jgi:hypothetical protein
MNTHDTTTSPTTSQVVSTEPTPSPVGEQPGAAADGGGRGPRSRGGAWAKAYLAVAILGLGIGVWRVASGGEEGNPTPPTDQRSDEGGMDENGRYPGDPQPEPYLVSTEVITLPGHCDVNCQARPDMFGSGPTCQTFGFYSDGSRRLLQSGGC